LYLVFTELVD